MAKMGIVENGLKKRNGKSRRRNPVSVAKASKNPARRRTVGLATAKSVAKRNGLKLVSIANPKRKRHHKRRRNGVTSVKGYTSRARNGLFGNTKQDAHNVAALGGGLFLTRIVGNFVSGWVNPLLAQIGLGQYSTVITNAGISLLVIPMIAKKVYPKGKDMARLGGLFATTLSALEIFAPSIASQINPFNNSPVVMTGNGAAITPAAVAQIAAGVAASPNPSVAAAKVGNAMYQLDASGGQGYADSSYSVSPELAM